MRELRFGLQVILRERPLVRLQSHDGDRLAGFPVERRPCGDSRIWIKGGDNPRDVRVRELRRVGLERQEAPGDLEVQAVVATVVAPLNRND